MPRAVGSPNALMGNAECVEPSIEGPYVFLRRSGTLGIISREEELRCAVIVVRTQERATLSDTVAGCVCQGCDPVTRLRPSPKPPLRISRADMLDRLKDLGRVGTIRSNIVQRAHRLKVVGLIVEKPLTADIAMPEDRVRTDDRCKRRDDCDDRRSCQEHVNLAVG